MPVKLLMMGRLSPWKGQLEFLQALLLLQNRMKNTDWEAEIVGGSLFGEHDYEEQLRVFIHSNNLEHRVSMRGHVQDVTGNLAASHIVVHASILPEPFGQVIVQGMAAGRAVIAANTGGPLDIITPNHDGILIDPKNTYEFASELNRLILDHNRRRALGDAAQTAAEKYSVPLVVRQVRKALAV